MLPTPPSQRSAYQHSDPHAQATYQFPQQQMMPQAHTTNPLNSPSSTTPVPRQRRTHIRIVAAVIVVGLAIALYFIWSSPTTTPASPTITQQNISTSSFTTNATDTTTNPSTGGSGEIQVYVVGAVKHPGVYTLPADARIYQLLQVAGGPLPNANLVAMNMAAKLSDGQEVYVAVIGETPPANLGGVPGPGTGPTGTGTGQLININTASVDQMRLALHISSKSAQEIVDYRTQHGSYASVNQLSQVVSKAIYAKIKDQVTV